MKKSYLLTAAVAGMLMAGTAPTHAGNAEVGKCHGVNGCGGQGSCATKSNSCKGHNSCKGQGWTEMSEKECKDLGGKFEAKS